MNVVKICNLTIMKYQHRIVLIISMSPISKNVSKASKEKQVNQKVISPKYKHPLKRTVTEQRLHVMQTEEHGHARL